MNLNSFSFRYAAVLFFIVALHINVFAQKIPSPKEHFGFNIGDDYMLANYTQTEGYFKKLAAVSDRVILQEIGKTEEGRSQYILIISSPANLGNIGHYKQISQKMARAENLSETEAKKLAMEGKPVVWIDGGLHANEVVATQQLIELCYQLLSNTDNETMRILDNTIILLSQVNPDGQELLSNWYMQENDPKKRNMNIPRLYEKYAGHDNNRDFYMNNLKESENISRQQYIEWMPQIIYNHHQTSPAGAVVAGPPYRDPFNFTIDPLVITGIDEVGAAMISRLNAENKPGFTRLDGSPYSTWWNGGLRTTPYFHNMIGILTEITGSPAPTAIPLVPDRLMPDNATPFPVTPQKWNFRRSIDYSISLSYAVLDYASRNGDRLLHNIYVMGKNAIEKGNKDTWTLQPKMIDSLKTLNSKRMQASNGEGRSPGNTRVVPLFLYDSVFRDPQLRDAKAYIISSAQSDFLTAIKFINALIKSGVSVQRATGSFQVQGKEYPAGSYIVKTGQAFRAHVLDMFEPQDHPNDFQYPGGPPVRPYDAAGWTLAFQMGVAYDRITEPVTGSFETINYGELQKAPEKRISASSGGYLLSSAVNDNYTFVNDLLKTGAAVYRVADNTGELPAGSFYVSSGTFNSLRSAREAYGLSVKPVNKKPAGLQKILPYRIALYDQYGGSITSGWTRWILEQFHFPFQLIYPQDIDRGNLNEKYDVILFIGRAIPAAGREVSPLEVNTTGIPKEYQAWLGNLSTTKSIPALRKFLENGGDILTVGSSTDLAFHLGLPVRNALTELNAEGDEKLLSVNKYYIPGSILEATIDKGDRANWGMPGTVDVVFNNSPVFSLAPGAVAARVKPLAWYSGNTVLRSGWAWGQSYLADGLAAFSAPVGKGMFYAYGPEITFRGQSHSTFKMLFNQLWKTVK